MKWKIFTLLAAAAVILGIQGSAVAYEGEGEGDVEDVSVFYDSLSPYGDWIYTEEYGYVWKPVGIAPDWRPYTYGHWVWTEEHGWYWVSNYEWGWAPFHYGRWVIYPAYGWVWLPGTVWAPAWVTWRYSDVYIGWYPLWPEFVVVTGLWMTYPIYVHHDHWVFVETRHFGSHGQHRHYIPSDRAGQAYAATKESHEYRGHGNETYLAGPSRVTVEKSAGHKYEPARLSDSSRPVPFSASHKPTSALKVYRPQFGSKSQVLLPSTTAAKIPEAARPAVGRFDPPKTKPGAVSPGRPGGMPGAGGKEMYRPKQPPLGKGSGASQFKGSGSARPGTGQGYKRPGGSVAPYAPREYPHGEAGSTHRPAYPGGVQRPAAPDGDGEGTYVPPAKPKVKGKEKKAP
ncbi:MAG: hypothetical protein HY897_10605 [Deltaproteobacteria bacterium]|nr:hypothetical protein [Deltaproteobacteria bacterium]